MRCTHPCYFLLLAISLAVFTACSQEPTYDNTPVYFISPQDGDTVSSPFTVRFGLQSGMSVAPAGVVRENSGHHHLIINAPLPNLNQPIPLSEQYIHYGKGQTESEVTLPAGEHTLQLLFGDAYHRPHETPLYSKVITITVR